MMIAMVVLLLAMNTLLVCALGLLWRRFSHWEEKQVYLEETLKNRIMELEQRLNHQEQKQAEQPGLDWHEVMAQSRMQDGSSRNTLPERYKVAVNMADNGLDLHQLSNSLGISRYEAEQLASLAQLAQRYSDPSPADTECIKE